MDAVERVEKLEVLTEGNRTRFGCSGRDSEDTIEQLERSHQMAGCFPDGVLGWIIVGIGTALHELGDERQGLARVTKIVDEPARDLAVHRAAVHSAEDVRGDGQCGRDWNSRKLYQAGF